MAQAQGLGLIYQVLLCHTRHIQSSIKSRTIWLSTRNEDLSLPALGGICTHDSLAFHVGIRRLSGSLPKYTIQRFQTIIDRMQVVENAIQRLVDRIR
jgi:hypothetical protein